MQAVARYPERAESLMRERVRRMRDLAKAHFKKQEGSNGSSRDWERAAKDGMSALERFGAELESMLSGAPVTAGNASKPASAPPAAPPQPQVSFGELETELSRVLTEEGIVVRAHDVARVVSLMSGSQITWSA
jgi:hypothetical protein